MTDIKIDPNLVSYCWLYCGSCKKNIVGECPGCKKLEKTPFWCPIRDCCIEKGISNCATCNEYDEVKLCRKYNGIVMRSLSYLCGSDRFTATQMIKEKGIDGFAQYMAENKFQRIPRK